MSKFDVTIGAWATSTSPYTIINSKRIISIPHKIDSIKKEKQNE